MPSTYSDQSFLADSAPFRARVQQALVAGAISVASEAVTVAHHAARAAYVAEVMANPPAFISRFAMAVAAQQAVIDAATGNGAVVLDGTNVATRQALITDAQLNAALNTVFNAFVRV